MNDLESFRGRRLDPDRLVWVYRDLNRRDGVWYSIHQMGLVVAHARSIVLHDCRFLVNQAGALRALESGRKNVHAFVRGYADARTLGPQEPRRGWYNRWLARFEVEVDGGGRGVAGADHVWLDAFGLIMSAPVLTPVGGNAKRKP